MPASPASKISDRDARKFLLRLMRTGKVEDPRNMLRLIRMHVRRCKECRQWFERELPHDVLCWRCDPNRGCPASKIKAMLDEMHLAGVQFGFVPPTESEKRFMWSAEAKKRAAKRKKKRKKS